MEQIVRTEGLWYYGTKVCQSPDDAYRLFREDYHKSIGRDANRRLNREGSRTDILHWHGFNLSEEYFRRLESRFGKDEKRVKSSVIGILCTSYCRTVDFRTVEVDESDIDGYIDWVLSDRSGMLVLVNRKNGLGRTNKRNNINFK